MKDNKKSAPRTLASRSLFFEVVQAKVLLVRTRLPYFETYNGSTTLLDHLAHFENTMLLHIFNDMIYCEVFDMTLRFAIYTWFNQLPSSLISSYEKLTEWFTAHFMVSKPLKKRFLLLDDHQTEKRRAPT